MKSVCAPRSGWPSASRKARRVSPGQDSGRVAAASPAASESSLLSSMARSSRQSTLPPSDSGIRGSTMQYRGTLVRGSARRRCSRTAPAVSVSLPAVNSASDLLPSRSATRALAW